MSDNGFEEHCKSQLIDPKKHNEEYTISDLEAAYAAGKEAGLERAAEICTEDDSDDGGTHDQIWNAACKANAEAIREEIKK